MVDWVGGHAPFPTIHMLGNIVIEGEVIVALCFIVGLMLGWHHAHKKAFAIIEERTPQGYTTETIGCEGCGKDIPIHVWEMLGNNCHYGTCVGGRWLIEEWMRLYEEAIDAYLDPQYDNDFVLDRLDELQVRSVEINHQQYLE